MNKLTLTWDDLRERTRRHHDIPENKKCDALLALDVLQQIFGESFFEDQEHPLFGFFIDRAGWRLEWATWFAQLLSSLNQHPDFSNLVQGLRKPKQYDERMTVLNIIEILISAGFSFRLDSGIEIGGFTKIPDLFVEHNAGRPGFYVEITRLGPSEKQRKAYQSFQDLWGDLHTVAPISQSSGHLERALAPRHGDELKQQILATINKAQKESGFETLEIAGVIQFAYAAESRIADLQEWAAVRNMKAGELSGPRVEEDEFDRIAFKLSKKIKQIPEDRANVVVIYPHLFTIPPSGTQDFANFVHALEELVYEHPHIGYLVLVFSWTGGSENRVFRYRDHICVNRCRLYFNCESMMLIKNRFATTPMRPVVEEMFVAAFEQSIGRASGSSS